MASETADSLDYFESNFESLILNELEISKNKNTSPSLKAQAQREILAQLHVTINANHSNHDSLVYLSQFEQHLHKYEQIVDERELTKGLDNYSSSVLDLIKTSCNSNGCDSWNLQDLVNLPAFQQLENDLKKETTITQLVPDFDQPLSITTKPEASFHTEEKGKTVQFEDRSKYFPENRENVVPQDAHHRPPELDAKPIPKMLPPPHSNQSRVHVPSPQAQPPRSHVPPPHNQPPRAHIPPPYNQPPKAYVPPPERKVEEAPRSNPSAFRTAKEQLIVDQQKKNSGGNLGNNYGTRPKSLGARRGLNSPFIPPIKPSEAKPCENEPTGASDRNSNGSDPEKFVDERLKNIEPKMIELIENEIMDHGPPVHWNDIAGLEFAKKTIKEIVVWPMLRPDLFSGLRGPPRGILLFGPPGTGKTLIGKCIASQSKSTFFSISASSLTSKWVGEGEKMVRALFAVARVQQPSVIFIDEIDSLLSQRSDTEHESSRRIKTEFLVQLDGATTSSNDRILVIGATNRPQELDEAARRRLVKRLYIPLPESVARTQLVVNTLKAEKHSLSAEEIEDISRRTDGYSGADMANLCKEAAFGPLREISMDDMESIAADQVRPITSDDFDAALLQVRASVSTQDLALYDDWNQRYGSGAK